MLLPVEGHPVGTGAVAVLRRARARRLLRTLFEATDESAARPVLRCLNELGRTDPEALVEMLSDPATGVLIDCGQAPKAVALVAFELAWRGRLGTRIELAPLSLWSADRGIKIDPGPSVTRLALANGELFARTAEGATQSASAEGDPPPAGPLLYSSRPFPKIRERTVLGLFDPNPLHMLEAHPEKAGNALSLGDEPLEKWIEGLRRAMALIGRLHPELEEEMRLLMRCIHPTGTHREKQWSASYREYLGALYLTLHPSELSTLEALVHEFQHNKLNLMAQHYELIENAWSPLYPSPVRPDPRPLMGVLLAAHAFVAVAELYRRMRSGRPRDAAIERRLAELVSCNEAAVATLRAHARWTTAGRNLFAEIEALHARHLALRLSLPPGVAHDP